VHWPIQPVEKQRRFAPRFCPDRSCPQHKLPHRFSYSRHGSFGRADGRSVPRYRCSTCHATFSKQAFSVSYYLKRPELLAPVAAGLVNGAAHRQIARNVGCAASTVTRLAARLGRHALLLQVLALVHLPSDDTEDTVLDHAESFEGSQDDPIAIATLVGRHSWFVYGLDGSTHARTGRRSPFQELRRRQRPKRDPRGGHEGSAARLLGLRLRCGPKQAKLTVLSDDKPDYARALARGELHGRLRHVVLPNPERGPKGAPRSALARRRDAGMFANDLLHALLRHSLAHHHRETIAFPRRIVAALERAFLFGAWRNFIKGVSERRPDPTTPAMRKQLCRDPWTWTRLLARRLFPDRLPVPDSWIEIYRRDWTTPALPANTRHNLQHAF
jgi:transposase-like protein